MTNEDPLKKLTHLSVHAFNNFYLEDGDGRVDEHRKTVDASKDFDATCSACCRGQSHEHVTHVTYTGCCSGNLSTDLGPVKKNTYVNAYIEGTRATVVSTNTRGGYESSHTFHLKHARPDIV